MKELIKKLSDMRGISGFEYRLSDEILSLIKPHCDEVYTDALGNVIAVKRCGKENASKVMIEAHMDEIGLMVTKIDDSGFLTFSNVGGVDPRILPSSEVIVHGKKDLCGVIGAKPPHLQAKDESKKSIKIEDMAIDIGMTKQEAQELVSVGDSVTLSQTFSGLSEDIICGKTMDDRVGAAAVIKVLENLQKSVLDVDVYAVIAVQEEVGLRGSGTAAYSIMPDMAIAIDVCHGTTPDNSKDAFELGEGAVISVGPNIHPKLAKRLFDTAANYHVKTNVDVDGGSTGTDAWKIQITGGGIPTALISIPLRYMHTNVETLSLSDVKAVTDLLTFFIQNLDEKTEEWLCF